MAARKVTLNDLSPLDTYLVYGAKFVLTVLRGKYNKAIRAVLILIPKKGTTRIILSLPTENSIVLSENMTVHEPT